MFAAKRQTGFERRVREGETGETVMLRDAKPDRLRLAWPGAPHRQTNRNPAPQRETGFRSYFMLTSGVAGH
jgi:hypothetical protein